MQNSQCTICRRQGAKLFLKGERCLSSKCPMIKRPYPPGPKKKRRPSPLSEYGRQMMEKQRLKNWYNLREKEFKNYIKAALKRTGKENPADLLIRNLESRLDNAVFRLGLANSKKQAKQMVSHKYFLVNGKPVNVSSFKVKKGNIISLSQTKIKKPIIESLKQGLKKHKPPAWLELEPEKLEGKVIGFPTLEETAPPAEISMIFEFYSR